MTGKPEQASDTAVRKSPAPPGAALGQLLRGSLVTQLIHVAAKLGIADLLREGPKESRELAAAVGVDADALYRVLRALASLGIFVEGEPRTFALTPLAESLRSDVPGSLRGSAILYGERWWWQACGDLLYSVTTGRTAFDHVHGRALFDYMETAGGDAMKIFHDHQSNMTGQDAAAVVAAYDFSGFARVVDVGGGHGALAAAILRASPATTAVVFDRADVVAGTPQHLSPDVIGRCTWVAGDFFQVVPASGDAYVLKDIIHDWDDARATEI